MADPNPMDQIAPKLVGLIRLASALNAKDIEFYKTIDKDIKDESADVNGKLASLLNRVLQSTVSISTDLDPEDFVIKEGNDEENMKVIGNVLDSLFENVEIGLDNYSKAKTSTKDETVSSSNEDGYTYLDENDTSASHRLSGKMSYSKVSKPQLQFKEKVNNMETHPFRPWITAKPNAVIPFEESMKLIPAQEGIPEHYNNPYSHEIMNSEYPEWIFSPMEDPYIAVPWKGSPPPTWIDQPGQLDDLLVELAKCKVIGVDLEHHDYRTYHGLTSLMQITTETKKDYLIDPLSPELRPHLSLLNIIFTDPKIVKVFHGAFMDMVWLQRDLGLYVVSLFDTYWASKELALGKYSLAFLLEKYVHFRTSKKWQLADWRIRPLSPEMRNYAKADTHFLIDVFCRIQADLLKKPGSMRRVLYESRKVSDRRFEYATYKPENPTANGVVFTNGSVPQLPEYQDQPFSFGLDRDLPWTNLMRNNGLLPAKGPIVEALFKWRDNKARIEDESHRYIMSDFVLSSLANSFTPDLVDQITETSVLNVINRSARFGSSYYVRKCIKELTRLIRDVMKRLSKMDLKAWDLATNTPPVASNLTGTADVYKSVKDIDRLEDEFNDFYSQYNRLNFPEVGNGKNICKLEDDESNLQEDQAWSVDYSKKGSKFVKGKEAEERLEQAIEHLSKYEAPVLELEKVVNEEEEVEDEQEEKKEEEKEEPVPKEDPDEIITLRKHNRNKGGRKQQDAQSSSTETIDLSKKIMQAPSRHERKKTVKKRSYDPYAESGDKGSDIPKLKKRKRRDIGRNAVFKR
ncbi:DEKNAAC102539 [Brettanomyces naardenensis]|uniref:DEKNAAC102539 n=1 Tax=Brettanomyces naardenensis TaxID=13370 RepID=A0A448YLI6_BRENA|nr:DEKNAAC102539 [Brettanomyces naardenensis]